MACDSVVVLATAVATHGKHLEGEVRLTQIRRFWLGLRAGQGKCNRGSTRRHGYVVRLMERLDCGEVQSNLRLSGTRDRSLARLQHELKFFKTQSIQVLSLHQSTRLKLILLVPPISPEFRRHRTFVVILVLATGMRSSKRGQYFWAIVLKCMCLWLGSF